MPGQTAIWLDGAVAAALPLPDRGLEFGDGLFETLLLHRGAPLFSNLHMDRLQRGLRALHFPDCSAAVREQLQLAATEVGARGWTWTALRLTISRGGGPRGYAPPDQALPRIITVATELDRDCAALAAPAVLSLASMRWPQQPALAGYKTLNRLEQVLAAAEYRGAGADEAVMLDQAGQPVSVVAGNLFLLRGKQLLTPPLRACGIAGTRRRLLMQRWAPAVGLEALEAELSLADLEAADELLYCNSLLGLRPVARFGARTWTSHTIAGTLFEQYRGDIA